MESKQTSKGKEEFVLTAGLSKKGELRCVRRENQMRENVIMFKVARPHHFLGGLPRCAVAVGKFQNKTVTRELAEQTF